MKLVVCTEEELHRIVRDAVAEALQGKQGGEEQLLSQKEAAEFLGVSKITLIRWVKNGEIATIRAGRSVRFRKSDLLSMGKKE